MEIKINENKPWLQQGKTLLYKLALEKTNGNKKEAAELLGCGIDTIKKEVRRNKELHKFYISANKPDTRQDQKIKIAIEMGFNFTEIAKTLGKNRNTISKAAKRILTKQEYDKVFKKNMPTKKEKKMLSTDDILNNNRVILAEIAEKIRENKFEELSNEHATYAKILFNNGFINEKGEVTEEGINALYH